MKPDFSSLSSDLLESEVKDICKEVTARNTGKKTDLSEFATKNEDAVRQEEDVRRDLSGAYEYAPFQVDNRRIAFSNEYQRLSKKTQVCTRPQNDHVASRLIHTDRVILGAKAVAKAIGANEDLTEAIARGHDIGHSPLGHLGEAFITRAIYDFNDKLMNVLGVFKHNIQGLHVVDRVASRKGVGGAGLNLTHQVRHGIISHDGESGKYSVEPNKIIVADYDKDIKRYLEKVIEKSGEIPFVPSDEIKNESDVVNEYRGKVLGVLKGASITPVTLEACIVFIMDVLSYLPQDFEDMVRMGVLRRDQIPLGIVAKLGDNIADMINNLITDVIIHSYEKNKIGYSEEMAEAVDCFKKFLYPNYYKVNSWAYAQGRDPRSQVPSGDIKRRMDFLFRRYHEALRDPLSHPNSSILGKFFTERKIKMYLDSVPEDKFRSSRTVVDYIAGFTDDYFFAESEDVNK